MRSGIYTITNDGSRNSKRGQERDYLQTELLGLDGKAGSPEWKTYREDFSAGQPNQIDFSQPWPKSASGLISWTSKVNAARIIFAAASPACAEVLAFI